MQYPPHFSTSYSSSIEKHTSQFLLLFSSSLNHVGLSFIFIHSLKILFFNFVFFLLSLLSSPLLSSPHLFSYSCPPSNPVPDMNTAFDLVLFEDENEGDNIDVEVTVVSQEEVEKEVLADIQSMSPLIGCVWSTAL